MIITETPTPRPPRAQVNPAIAGAIEALPARARRRDPSAVLRAVAGAARLDGQLGVDLGELERIASALDGLPAVAS